MNLDDLEQLADRLDVVREGMESGLDDWPTASQIWEYQQSSLCIRQLIARCRKAEASVAELEAQSEPVAWGNFKEEGTACLLSISQHPEDRANWMNPKPLYLRAPQAVINWRPLVKWWESGSEDWEGFQEAVKQSLIAAAQLPEEENQMTTEREQILALAETSGAIAGAIHFHGAEVAGIVFYSEQLEAFYHAARKPLEEEVELLKIRHHEARRGLDHQFNEAAELRQQLAEKDAEIERQRVAYWKAERIWKKQYDKLAAAQAQIVKYREALEEAWGALNYCEALRDVTAERERIVKKLGVLADEWDDPAEEYGIRLAIKEIRQMED